MRLRLALLAVLVLLPRPLPAADLPGGYSFQLDGQPYRPAVYSLRGTPEAPQPGDVIRVGEFLLTLGAEKAYQFRSTPDDDGRLLLAAKDGGVQVIAVKVSWTYKGDQKVVRNPLDKLATEELRGLRGLYLDYWSEPIARRLAHIDPKQTCVVLTDAVAQHPGKGLPALPRALAYLAVRERSNRGLEDYARLKELEGLKFLLIDAFTAPVDAAALNRADRLRYLRISGAGVRNAAELAALKQLRSLGLPGARELDSIAPASGMGSLVELDVQDTKVADLSPVGGNPSLASLNANRAPVRKLPDKPLPALRSLKVMSTQLDDKAVAAFAAAHPRCKVQFRWGQALRDELQGVTRVRVRSGGTCHRDVAREATLIDEKDPKAVTKLIDAIAIAERQSGFHCMCCGTPSFEFYKGDALVLTLGFHHGQGVRWVEGWPGDGALTEPSADALCQWLADRGHKGPLQERQEQKKRDAAARRQTEQYTALMPAKVIEKLQQAQSREAAVKAFQDNLPDEKAQAELYVKLFGVGNGSWNHYSGLDELLQNTLLPGLGKGPLAEALGQAKDGPALEGASRWLIGEEKWKTLDEAVLKQVLPAVAAHGVAHPRPYNRRQTLAFLMEVPIDAGLHLLRAALVGETKVRALAPEEEAEPGGMVVARPGDLDMLKGSDRAYAGLMLAKRKDAASREAIRKLAQEAAGEDKAVLEKALELLDKKP